MFGQKRGVITEDIISVIQKTKLGRTIGLNCLVFTHRDERSYLEDGQWSSNGSLEAMSFNSATEKWNGMKTRINNT